MPNACVVRCRTCSHFQAVSQLLPNAADDYDYVTCKQCDDRQPCHAHVLPDGSVLRSYNVREMRRQAAALNEKQQRTRELNTMYHHREKIFAKLEEAEKRRLQHRLMRLRETVH